MIARKWWKIGHNHTVNNRVRCIRANKGTCNHRRFLVTCSQSRETSQYRVVPDTCTACTWDRALCSLELVATLSGVKTTNSMHNRVTICIKFENICTYLDMYCIWGFKVFGSSDIGTLMHSPMNGSQSALGSLHWHFSQRPPTSWSSIRR